MKNVQFQLRAEEPISYTTPYIKFKPLTLVTGPNGAGKSLLLNSYIGLTKFVGQFQSYRAEDFRNIIGTSLEVVSPDGTLLKTFSIRLTKIEPSKINPFGFTLNFKNSILKSIDVDINKAIVFTEDFYGNSINFFHFCFSLLDKQFELNRIDNESGFRGGSSEIFSEIDYQNFLETIANFKDMVPSDLPFSTIIPFGLTSEKQPENNYHPFVLKNAGLSEISFNPTNQKSNELLEQFATLFKALFFKNLLRGYVVYHSEVNPDSLVNLEERPFIEVNQEFNKDPFSPTTVLKPLSIFTENQNRKNIDLELGDDGFVTKDNGPLFKTDFLIHYREHLKEFGFNLNHKEKTILNADNVPILDWSQLSSGQESILWTLSFLHTYSQLYLKEPEISLHPNWQSKLMEVFIDLTKAEIPRKLIIETHSEIFIRKLQLEIAKGNLAPEDCVIYFLTESREIVEINIDKTGLPSQPFPDGFMDEVSKLTFDLFLESNKN